MQGTPEIVTRAAQPYAAVRGQGDDGGASRARGPVRRGLRLAGSPRLAPAGPPFFRYNVIDMARQLDVEAGVPIETEATGDDQVLAGVLPAGRYATVSHEGHPSELIGAVRDLLDWAAGQQLAWDMSPGEDGEHWGCRLESYLTDPAIEPDMSKWVTELSFRLAG